MRTRGLPALFTCLLLAGTASCFAPDEASVRDSGADGAGAVVEGGRSSGGTVGITDAVVVLPPGGGPAAAYMTVGLAAGVDTLLGAELGDGRKIELHGPMTTEGGVGMRDVGPVQLTQAEALRIHPGESHFMIDSFAQLPEPGDVVPLVLTFARSGRLDVDARVVRYDQLDALFARGPAGGSRAAPQR